MNIILFISNMKLADLAIFLSSWIEASSCCKTFCYLILPINQVKVPESISYYFNLV